MSSHLFFWEAATIPPQERHQGILNPKYSIIATIIFILISILIIITDINFSIKSSLLALWIILSARALVVDLHHTILPNIYTALLFALGLGWVAFGFGVSWLEAGLGVLAGAVLPLLLWASAKLLRQPAVLGGGDVKFLLVMGLWLGPLHLCWALVLATILTLPLLIIPKARPLPMGPGLILATSIFLAHGSGIESWLIKLFFT